MSADIKPSSFFGVGYTVDAANHKISFQTSTGANPVLPQLTNAKADPTTGDFRDILFAIIDAAYQKQRSIDAGSRAIQLSLSQSVGASGTAGAIDLTYTSRFSLSPGGIYTILSEP